MRCPSACFGSHSGVCGPGRDGWWQGWVSRSGLLGLGCFFHILSGYRHMGASRLIRAVGPSGWVAGCDKCPVQAEKREGQEMSHYAFIRRKRKTKIPLHNILLTAILCCALSQDKAVK